MFTTQGGVEIEEVAANDPGRARAPARRPARGLPAVGRARGSSTAPASRIRASRSRSRTSSASSTAASSRCDAMLTEINPLIVTPDGEVKALDSKFTVDDSALYRHPDIAEFRDTSAADPLEAFAREKGVTYVKLDGSVGILGNGAGLSMSTVDVVVVAGGQPANFCDLGGGGNAEGVVDALEVITRDPQVKSILFNIFGGITRCDEVARGILEALDRMQIDAPDRRAPRRHERRGGPPDPRRRRAGRTSTSSRRCSTRRSRPWSSPHERRLGASAPRLYRTSVDARDAATISTRSSSCATRSRREGARRRDRRRPRRAPAARAGRGGRDASTRRPACSADVVCAGRGPAVRRRLVRRRRLAHRGAPLRRHRHGGRRDGARRRTASSWSRTRSTRSEDERGSREAARPDARALATPSEEWRELLVERGPRGRARERSSRRRTTSTTGSRAPAARATTPSACASCSRR